jgi:thiol:disulfide interchange protein
VGKIKPIGAKKKYDELWGGEYTYFTKKAEFRQRIRVLQDNPLIKGSFEYQVCSEKDGKCVPGEEAFDFTGIRLKPSPNQAQANKENASQEAQAPDTLNQQEATNPTGNNTLPPQQEAPQVKAGDAPSQGADTSVWGIIVAGVLAGLAALATPCVYPLIPMTVTFFLKQSTNRKQAVAKALLYGISIILIYTIPTTLLSLIFGGEINNFISTHWIPNTIFFLIFLVFGLSFLGLFELVLPSWVVNNIDAQADRGGYAGIFFMALTLVVVSFSCTAPFAGTISIWASQGNISTAILGGLSFSSALALPFTLFAIFPNWLKSLPRSGGWLNTVKVVFGFIELALALKFLSIIDQVYHWNLLDRDVFLAVWIVLFSLIGFYLLGKIQLPHDEKLEKVPVLRMGLAIVVFSFVVYLIPGLFGAPLKSLAGFLPPSTTIDDRNLYQQVASVPSQPPLDKQVKYANKFKLPHRLQGFFDYEQGLAYAKKVNKPIFIDFTGHGCVNCREMEDRVWSDPQVLSRLREQYVMIALYVDDKGELPEKEWYTTRSGKVKKSIGGKWLSWEIDRFGANAQPFYCLLDNQGRLLVKPKAYDLDPAHFAAFLDMGVENFKKGLAYEMQNALN